MNGNPTRVNCGSVNLLLGKRWGGAIVRSKLKRLF
jgi:hypothetical protein